MWTFCIALSGVLAALAWQLARQRPVHRAVAIFVTVNVIADVVAQALLKAVVEPAQAAAPGVPLGGLVRAAFHVTQAAFLVHAFGLAALAAAVLLEGPLRRRVLRGTGAAWLVAVVLLAAAYPTVRGPLLERVYLCVHMASLGAVAGAWAAWWQRRLAPSITTGCVLVLTLMEIGATTRRQPFQSWDFQAGLHMVAYGALAVWHGGELWGLRSRRSA